MSDDSRRTDTASLRVLMLGPALGSDDASAAVESILEAIPANGPDVRYVVTRTGGPELLRALVAIVGSLRLVAGVILWRPHIVHVHAASGAGLAREVVPAALARALRRRLIVHVHGTSPDTSFDQVGRVAKSAIRSMLARADAIIVPSAARRARLARLAPGAEIRVLAGPVVATDLTPLAEGRPDVPEGGGTVLFMDGQVGPRAVRDLIEAMPAVLRRRPDVVFELACGQDAEEIERWVEQRDLSESVRMLGCVTGGEKLATFARAHLYVLPSYHERPLTGVLEAMAAGLPVVATPVGGIPEVIKDQVNGLLVAPGDVSALAASITRLLGDDGLRRRVSAANVEHALSRHDASLVARRLIEWYHGLSGTGDA